VPMELCVRRDPDPPRQGDRDTMWLSPYYLWSLVDLLSNTAVLTDVGNACITTAV